MSRFRSAMPELDLQKYEINAEEAAADFENNNNSMFEDDDDEQEIYNSNQRNNNRQGNINTHEEEEDEDDESSPIFSSDTFGSSSSSPHSHRTRGEGRRGRGGRQSQNNALRQAIARSNSSANSSSSSSSSSNLKRYGEEKTCWKTCTEMKLPVFIISLIFAVLLFVAISLTGGTPSGIPPGCNLQSVQALEAMAVRVLKRNGVPNADKLVQNKVHFCVYNGSDSDTSVWLLQEAGWSWKERKEDEKKFSSRIKPVRDAFSVEAHHGVVYVTATTSSAAAQGFYWYLKNALGVQVTWGADQLDTLSKFVTETGGEMPDWPRTAVLATVSWRYAWNMVTFGYTSTWWDWDRWEQELDWMALHGINMPLALKGQEYLWIHVFAKFGIKADELEQWFSGPTFLPWQRAGNLQGFGGPLPMKWIEDQRDLQLKIIGRAKDFGMTPVLPCFAGIVPAAAQKAWPHAKFQKMIKPWNGFPSKYADVLMIDPTEPAFQEIASAFMDSLERTYGLSGYYSCDTFNENTPPSSNPDYLHNASKAVVDGIETVDHTGIWVMQAWLFSPGHFPWWQVPGRVKAYLSGAPIEKLLVLDLHAEDGSLAYLFDNFYGHASIWCSLNIYGGVRSVGAFNLSLLSSQPFIDKDRNGSTVVGFGFAPEAIEQNPIAYELFCENFFGVPFTTGGGGGVAVVRGVFPAARKYFNLEKWMQRYLLQRYSGGLLKKSAGGSHVVSIRELQRIFMLGDFDQVKKTLLPNVWKGWKVLWENYYSTQRTPRTELEDVPVIQGNQLGVWKAGSPEAMFSTMSSLMEALNTNEVDSETSAGLHYDLVDIFRQTATTYFTDVHAMFINMAEQNNFGQPSNSRRFNLVSTYLRELITKLDNLLGSDDSYLLGTWLQGATDAASKCCGATNKTIFDLFRFNAKNQVTMWGPQAQISDYAAKAWQGLYSHYYHMRWTRASEYVVSINGTGGWNYDNQRYNDYMLKYEEDWNKETNDKYSTSANRSQTIQQLGQALLSHISMTDSELASSFTKHASAAGDQVWSLTTYSLQPVWGREVRENARLCALLEGSCLGFTSNGYLLTSLPSPIVAKSGQADLYVRK